MNPSIRVSVDAKAFLEGWSLLARDMDSYGFQAWRRTTKDARESMHEHGYQNLTGELTASMRDTTIDGGPFDWSSRIDITAPHARYIDEGTRAHGPVRAKFLRWYVAGRPVFAKWVRGISPRRFSKEASDAFERDIVPNIDRALASAIGNG